MENEVTYYQLWQKNRFGNVLKDIDQTPEEELFESGIDELNRLSEFIESRTEKQLLDEEK